MKAFIAKNWFKLAILVIASLTVAGSFYWYEWRPTQIKHNCSWVKMHTNAIPAQPAILGPSEEEIKARQDALDNCKNSTNSKGINWDCINIRFTPERQAQPAQPAQPEKDWFREATKSEYDFCIHEKGL
jgi:hypothetical protein